MTWRTWNKWKSLVVIPGLFLVNLAMGWLDWLVALAVLSWVTWLDSSIAGWRADVPDHED